MNPEISSFKDKIQQVEITANQKEVQRQLARTEAATKRQEMWKNLVSGAKDKIKQFKEADQQAGRTLRKIVDMAPGVAGAMFLTTQEKATEARNLGYDVANTLAQNIEASKEKTIDQAKVLGKRVVRGAEIGVGVGVFLAVEAVNIVQEGIRKAVDTGEKVGSWLTKKGGEIRDGAQKLKQEAVDGYHSGVDRVKTAFNETRQEVTTSFLNTRDEIVGDVNRTITKGKNRVVAFHHSDVANKHDAIAGLYNIEHQMASGVAGFLESMKNKVDAVAVQKLESRDKNLKLKTTHTEVAAALRG